MCVGRGGEGGQRNSICIRLARVLLTNSAVLDMIVGEIAFMLLSISSSTQFHRNFCVFLRLRIVIVKNFSRKCDSLYLSCVKHDLLYFSLLHRNPEISKPKVTGNATKNTKLATLAQLGRLTTLNLKPFYH